MFYIKKNIFILLLFFLALISTQSFANLRLISTDHTLLPAEKQATEKLLADTLTLLPPKFKQLDLSINVQWSSLPKSVYGRTTPTGITLNRKLLPILNRSYSTSSSTQEDQILLKTMIHELSHVYDRSQHWTKTETTLFKYCRRQAKTFELLSIDNRCRSQSKRSFTVSDNPHFLDLAGWPQQVGTVEKRESTNYQTIRTPDPYELTNPQEFFAVNMEYFLLDSSYHCRRPSLANFFADYFSWKPSFQKISCDNKLPYLNSRSDFSNNPLSFINPDRVYAVDFLLAEDNQQLLSLWGHSMLRLVICAPGHKLGPKCRLDLEQHLVLSYRAFVGDVQLSSWDGLMGNYPSRLFILPLSQVIDEYTKTELRSVASIPLKLNRQQISRLVTRSIEQHWSYDGNYFFLTNNCAVEILKLMRSSAKKSKLQSLDSIMPKGLLDLLASHNLANKKVLINRKEALRQGYLFDSYRKRYQEVFAIARKQLPIQQKTIESWFALSAIKRNRWFEQGNIATSASFLLLEKAILRQKALLAQDEIKQRYLTGKEHSETDIGATLKKILANSGFLSRPGDIINQGYGIPQTKERKALYLQSKKRQVSLLKLKTTLSRQLKQLITPNLQHEIKASEANIRHLTRRIRTLNLQNNGIELP